jgi:hypothetical protein
MAGLSFSIGGTTYAALNIDAAGSYALGIKADASEYDIKRFHVPGVNGAYKVRGGRLRRKIVARVRYVGASADAAIDTYDTAMATHVNNEQTIVDDGGQSFTRCELLSMTRISEPRASGRGTVYLDAELVFSSDV